MASDTNGGQPAQQPSMNVLGQYVKDFSFENPGAPGSLRMRDKPPTINVGINVNANPLSPTDIEVELKVDARATEEGDKPLFVLELNYAGIFRIVNVPQEQLHPIVMIECPRLLFPFARQIVADATRDGGFPPLMVDPVDFVSLYQQRLAEANPQTA